MTAGLAAGASALARRAAIAAALIAVAWAAPAHAQMKTDGFRVDRFEMAPSVEDGLVTQDPGVLRHMGWSVSATLGFTNTVLRVVPKLSSDTGIDVVGPRLSAYLDFAMGFRERFEVNLSLPFALAQSTESGVAAGFMLSEASSTTALGDARVGGSVLIYGRRTGPQVGLAATMAIPLGSEDSFTGDGGIGGEVTATGAYVEPKYRVLLNGGVRFRPEADYVTSDQGTELIGRAAVIVPFMKNRLNASLEFDVLARTSGDDAYNEMGSPVLALLGARYRFANGFRAGAGVGMGLTEAPGSPAIRTLITVGYSPEPRKKPVERPRPLDADNDGIPDTLDKCRTEAEDYDGIQDGDGCPDPDGDIDKIPDTTPDKPLTLEQVITLPAPIEFYFDTAIMRPGADVYLKQVLAVLQQHAEVLKLEIQGHTSSEGGPEYNLKLSNDRAKAVFQWLVDHGIEASRLVPRGYGLTVPLVPNDSEANRQKNRRVQFRLLDQTPGTAPPIGPGPGTGTGTTPATPAQPAPGTAPATPAPAPTGTGTTPPATPATAPAPKAPATTPAAPAPAPAPKAPATTPAAPAPAPAPKAPATTPAPATAPAAAATPAPKAPTTAPAPTPAPAAAAPAPKAPATAPAPATTPKAAPAPATTPKAAPTTPAPAPAPKAPAAAPAPAPAPAPKTP